MTGRGRRAVGLALIMAVMAMAGPLQTGGLADPVTPGTLHIQTFSDGSEEVVGLINGQQRLQVDFEVPVGSKALSAKLTLSRARYQVFDITLEEVPHSLWCGDLDNDGMEDDMLVTFPLAGRVDLFSIAGDPPLVEKVGSLQVPDAMSVAVDDLDRDRDKDVMVTSASEGRLYVFESTGVLEYAAPRVVPVGPRPDAVAAQDLDPDFKKDVVVVNSGGSSLTILRGRGDLGFYPRTVELGRGPTAIALRDMDRDLSVDLVVAESRNSTVTVLFNEGNGNFSNATPLKTAEGPVDLDVRDLSGDSLYDIAVACAGTNETWIYRLLNGRTFELWEILPTGRVPRAVGGYQLNRQDDLNRDVVTACSGSDNLTVYLSDGKLEHTIPIDIPVGGRPVDLGTLRGESSVGDLVIALCQLPPSLSVASPLPVVDAMRLKVGTTEGIPVIEVAEGVEALEINFSKELDRLLTSGLQTLPGGVHKVHLEAWGLKSGWARISDLDVWIGQNTPPRADAGRKQTVMLGEPVLLNASASYDQEDSVLIYHWLLGGGTVIDSDHPTVLHTFTEPGTHFVLLVVVDPWGLQDQDDVEVRVNAPPLARGTVPDTVRAREPVRLSAHLSEDPDGTIEDYIWDYSQGVVHGRQVDVVFTGEGTWNVTLEVVDDLGARAVHTFSVQVLPSTEPLRPPAKTIPEDRGEVPGPGGGFAVLALTLATLVAALSHRRPRGA